MGFISWKTSDTNKPITNAYSRKGALPVYLITPQNEAIYETNYLGYGVFGKYDVFVLLANWNKPEDCNGNHYHDKEIGMELYKDNDILKYPLKFAENPYCLYDELRPAQLDERQGYYYKNDQDTHNESTFFNFI